MSSTQGGEVNLVLPDLGTLDLPGGLTGVGVLEVGLVACVLGLAFAAWLAWWVARQPVHEDMASVAALIRASARTYLLRQGRLLIALWAVIAVVIAVQFALLLRLDIGAVALILAFSAIGVAGSSGIAWFGILLNTRANARTAHAAHLGDALQVHRIPLRSGMAIGTALISLELLLMLVILLAVPRTLAGACFLGFAIGESLGAAVLRIAGGIFTKIADIGADLMKIALHIEEDDARNPGVIADCTGDNAGDSVGPSADGFESYGVTGVALITCILLGVPDAHLQALLLVWLFTLRGVLLLASVGAYALHEWRILRRRRQPLDVERSLTRLLGGTAALAVVGTFLTTWWILGHGSTHVLWWRFATMVALGTVAAALIPGLVRVFTSTGRAHVREIVRSAEQGGASLGILSGMVAGAFSAYWLGILVAALMAIAASLSSGIAGVIVAPAVFALGLLAFGFLGTGPITIAVDAYGPIADNAQSIFELSLVSGGSPAAKRLLEENDAAGNTFKATAKPVLIGTAVVGATTMTFSIIMRLTDGMTRDLERFSVLHWPFLVGIVLGGSMIQWFSGAAIQAVTTGAHRAVALIARTIDLEGTVAARPEDSQAVVDICTRYAQRGMVRMFLGVLLGTLGLAFLDPFLFVGYLIGLSVFGLLEAIRMANAGGAWDNAKKIVEVELQQSGTPLHDATIVGDTVGDPLKDTASVSLNPVIKFSTLFGLLAVDLSLELSARGAATISTVLAWLLLAGSLVSVHRSFYGMRIPEAAREA